MGWTKKFNRYNGLPSMVLGNFNVYLIVTKKIGGAQPNIQSMRSFNDCMRHYNLINLGFQG